MGGSPKINGVSRVIIKWTKLRKEYVGKKIGYWRILDIMPPNETSNKMAYVRCICGKEKEVRWANIIEGKSKGCGSCIGKLRKGEKRGKYKPRKKKDGKDKSGK